MKDDTTNSAGERVYWKERISKNGNKYEVGYLEEEDSLQDEKTSASLGKKKPYDFDMVVDWKYTRSGHWVDTSISERETLAITRYLLGPNVASFYANILQFTPTKKYNYFFEDETGDIYQCNVFDTDKDRHSVSFNSKKPNIVRVMGYW